MAPKGQAKTTPTKAGEKTPSTSPSKDKDGKKKNYKNLFSVPQTPLKMTAVNARLRVALLKGFGFGIHVTNEREIPKTPWMEKLLNDCFLEGADFLQEYFPIKKNPSFLLHVNNVAVPHFSGCKWNHRYFLCQYAVAKDAPEDQVKEAFREIGAEICDGANARRNKEEDPYLYVPEKDEDFFYEPRDNLVVSDVIGIESAKILLRDTLGRNYAAPFEENRDFILTYFRPGEIPRTMQGYLSAPDEEVGQDD